MSNQDLDKLKSLRGWGPVLVERILESVKKIAIDYPEKENRTDDEPLPGERQF